MPQSFQPITGITVNTMLTQLQYAQNSPIPSNDLGVPKDDDLHDVLLTGAVVFNAKSHHRIRGYDGYDLYKFKFAGSGPRCLAR
jgi:hypothetical protein